MGWGEFFALASALTWALAVILMRRSGETLPAFELNLFKNCFGLALLVPTTLIISGIALPYYTSTELVVVLLSGSGTRLLESGSSVTQAPAKSAAITCRPAEPRTPDVTQFPRTCARNTAMTSLSG